MKTLGNAVAVTAIIMILLTGRFAAGSHPLGLDENLAYGILTDKYETPHVKWAKPYAGGTIKALVMAPEWSQRETVELAQRLSLDYTPWMPSAFSKIAIESPKWWFPEPMDLIGKLLEDYVTRDFDVIVIGKLDWKMLPEKERFAILKKVQNGTGLVYVCPPEGNAEIDMVFSAGPAQEGAEFIKRAIPFALLPQLKSLPPEKIVRAGIYGKGRVVSLNYGQKMPEEKRWGNDRAAVGYPALTPQWTPAAAGERLKGYIAPDDCPEMEFIPYEYYQSLVARAVVWASGKDAKATLSEVILPETVDYPASSHKAQVSASSAPAGSMLKTVVRSRHEYERVYNLPSQKAQKSNNISLPSIPSGEYILDIWLVSGDGKVFDWTSKNLAVRSDIEVNKISLDGKSYNPGEKITGTATFSRNLSAGETAAAELWDNYGRKISEQILDGTGDVRAFSFALVRPLVIMHNVRVRVVKNGNDACSKLLNFPVRAKLKGTDDFSEIIWSDQNNTFLTNAMLRKLAKYDQADAILIGSVREGGTYARDIAAANLAVAPHQGRFGYFTEKTIPAKFHPCFSGDIEKGYGCMSDPETLQEIDEWGALNSDIFGPYGPLVWDHGDESSYSNNPDTCWSDTCLAAFREYLKTRYAGLDALNKEWKTQYKTWDEVMPLTYEDAIKSGNYAPWIEHRFEQQFVFARFYGRTVQALSANDAGAKGGFDGGEPVHYPNTGMNWWLLKDHIQLLQNYVANNIPTEIVRSFAGPDHITGMWYGTYGPKWEIGPSTVEHHHFFPWYSLFHGLNSSWFWTLGAPGAISGYAPDLTALPFMQASRDELAEIRTGTGKLLLAGRLQDDGIAIHYSEGSKIAAGIFYGNERVKQGEKPPSRPTGEYWLKALADFNKALEHSGLQYRYVAYEEVEKNALTERGYSVFIMPHSYLVSQKEADAIRKFVNDGGLLIADIMPGMLNGHGTMQEKSMLADLFPSQETGTVNNIGKGKTVLLGNKLADYGYSAYRTMSGWGKLKNRHKILAQLLEKEAGITPKVIITHRGTGDMPPTEIFRIKAGDIEYAGLLREYYMYDNKPYPATVKLPRKSHLYNMRSGKYLGFTDTLDTDISYEAQLYGMMPYRVSSLNIEGPGAVKSGGETSFRISVISEDNAAPSLHVFRVELTDPAGEKLPWYAANVKAEKGSAVYIINWALNEKPGRYTIQAKDIATGVSQQKTVDVK